MKRIVLNLFRNIEQKNKQQLIGELLTLDSTIEESVLLFEKVKADFLFKLEQKQNQIKKESDLIDKVKAEKVVIDLNDIETSFELLSTQKSI